MATLKPKNAYYGIITLCTWHWKSPHAQNLLRKWVKQKVLFSKLTVKNDAKNFAKNDLVSATVLNLN